MAHSTWLFLPEELGNNHKGGPLWDKSLSARPLGLGKFLLCSLGLMADILQSEQRRGISRKTEPSKQKWLLASLRCCEESLELRPLFPLLGTNPLPENPEGGPASQSGAHWGRRTST